MNADFIRIQVPPCVGFGTEWVSKAVEVIKMACACACVLDTRDGGLINMTDVFTVFSPQWNTTAVCVCVWAASSEQAETYLGHRLISCTRWGKQPLILYFFYSRRRSETMRGKNTITEFRVLGTAGTVIALATRLKFAYISSNDESIKDGHMENSLEKRFQTHTCTLRASLTTYST